MLTEADIASSLNLKEITDQKLLRRKQDCINSTWSKTEGLGLCATFNLEPEHLLSLDEEQILSAR